LKKRKSFKSSSEEEKDSEGMREKRKMAKAVEEKEKKTRFQPKESHRSCQALSGMG